MGSPTACASAPTSNSRSARQPGRISASASCCSSSSTVLLPFWPATRIIAAEGRLEKSVMWLHRNVTPAWTRAYYAAPMWGLPCVRQGCIYVINMILRRSRAAAAGLVVGPALALPFGAHWAAHAQTFALPPEMSAPAPAGAPAADTLKQRDQELDAIRAQQRESSDSQARLRLQIKALGRDRRALNEQLI